MGFNSAFKVLNNSSYELCFADFSNEFFSSVITYTPLFKRIFLFMYKKLIGTCEVILMIVEYRRMISFAILEFITATVTGIVTRDCTYP